MVALNKCDMLEHPRVPAGWSVGVRPVLISAKTHEGLEELKQRMVSLIPETASMGEGSVHITNRRHFDALSKAIGSLSTALESALSGSTGEFVAFDIRECLEFLSEITGEITSEEILDSIFSRFCIGK